MSDDVKNGEPMAPIPQAQPSMEGLVVVDRELPVVEKEEEHHEEVHHDDHHPLLDEQPHSSDNG